MTAQTVIYCVGAAKAGTSWLFDYLYAHPECHFPTTKELHYWDGLKGGHGDFFRDQLPARIADIRARYERNTTDPVHRAYQAANMADIQRWYELFDGVSRDDAMYLDYMGVGRVEAQVVGDFTPAYATLPEDWMREMASVHADTRAIYLLREPVDRLWSHFRMDAGGDGARALEKMDAYLAGGEETVARRSNYRQALNRLGKVFGAGRLHVELFERLFTPQAVGRICDFLGISRVAAAFDKQVHASASARLDDDRRARAQHALRQQYNFIERFLGGMPGEWTQKMVTA